MKCLFVLLCATVFLGTASGALADRVRFAGYGGLVSNDFYGDGEDRWRSGGVSVSLAFARAPEAGLPKRAFALTELRLRADGITPERLTLPFPPNGDRRYAGVLGVGGHTHFERAGWEVSAGLDLVMTGAQTGIGDLHQFLHELFGGADLVVRESQIGNGFYPTGVLEIGRSFDFGGNWGFVRPFAEAQAGVETFARLGADMVIGPAGKGGLWARDNGTGQRYRVIPGGQGFGLTLGGDVAYVARSELLPSSLGYRLTPLRSRARAGLLWSGGFPIGEQASMFAGWTWLGEEFEAQRAPQITSTFAFSISF